MSQAYGDPQSSKNSHPPSHLSEFYSYIEPRQSTNSPRGNGHSRVDSASSLIGHVSDGFASMMRRPSSGSLHTVGSTIASTSFANVTSNHPDLPALITSNEIKSTIGVYTELKEAASKYREALMVVSKAAADFGSALEACSRVKGAGTSSEGLMAAGGLHYLVSNHQNILANAISGSFESPVEKELKYYQEIHKKNEDHFKAELKAKTKRLKRNESLAQKMARQRIRNLSEYRNSLLELTSQIDDIDKLKYEYFQGAYNLAQQVSTEILGYASSVVRAEVEIYEGIARKGWSGGGLDDLIAACPDPFAKEDEDDDEGKKVLVDGSGTTVSGKHEIFSVLSNRSLLPKRISSSDEVETLRKVNGAISGRTNSNDEIDHDVNWGEDEVIDDSFNTEMIGGPLSQGNNIGGTSTPLTVDGSEIYGSSTPKYSSNTENFIADEGGGMSVWQQQHSTPDECLQGRNIEKDLDECGLDSVEATFSKTANEVHNDKNSVESEVGSSLLNLVSNTNEEPNEEPNEESTKKSTKESNEESNHNNREYG